MCEEQEEEHQLMHEYRFYIRRNLVRQPQLAQSRSMFGEVPCRNWCLLVIGDSVKPSLKHQCVS